MESHPVTEHPSGLARKLTSGLFVVAAELSPPRGIDREGIIKEARLLRDYTDALNVTDNQAANVRMASIPVCSIVAGEGVEPVAQMTCRDRNRLAIQADLMGAAALGIKNILCLGGDHNIWGGHPQAKNVFDLDSTQLVRIVRNMVEEGCLDNGRIITPKPEFFIGAVANPFAPPLEYRPLRLAKKAAAGAQFFQTQLIFNVDIFGAYMAKVRDYNLDKKVYILAGVGPLKTARTAQFMAEKIPGIDIPEKIIERMVKTPKAAQAQEGMDICCEIIEQVRAIKGVAGIHIMAVSWPEAIAEIVRRAGLYPRPSMDAGLAKVTKTLPD